MDEACSRRKRRRPPPPPPLDRSSVDRTVFPLLLAAAAAGDLQNPHSRSIVLRFLRAHLALLTRKAHPSSASPPSTFEPPLPEGLLALFPLFLTSRWPSVAALSAEVVGAATLFSLETNEIVALDDGIVKALVCALGSGSHRVVKAACNAVLDLSTSPVGRGQLLKAVAVEKLLSLFYQVSKLPASCRGVEKGNNECSKRRPVEENLVPLVLAAVVILVNASTDNLLDRISREVIKRSLPLLQESWKKVQGSSLPRNWQRCLHFTKSDLAITIFKISMNQANLATCDFDKVRISMFGSKGSNFENFMLKYWENSPFLLTEASNIPEKDSVVFSSLIHSFNTKSTNDVLDSILMELVSCPPLASDEIDVDFFLNEVSSSSLGSPLIYGQDIRVLKAQQLSESFKEYVKKEVHLFENGMHIDGDYAQKCKEAFHNGFTIALRGMEFRLAKVAAIAKGLADLFGQPSVGANLYLTPRGSQGLACHYDDHCVFVWQLFGQKHWTISSSPTSILPRLYEPLNSSPRSENETDGGLKMFLGEGDILYIPRGYSHEAHTETDDCEPWNKISSGFSLHLTLSVEIEPPFQWEGFAHVALHCWHEKEKESSNCIISSKARRMEVFSVLLLHVAIRLTANHNPIFRKACLVAATFCSSKDLDEHHAEILRLGQKATFQNIMDIINASCNFMEAFNNLAAIQEGNDNSLQWMRWLRHLPQCGDDDEKMDFGNLLRMRDELIHLCSQETEEIKAGFFRIKSKICRSVVYEDACKVFHILLEKYRRTREQYMNGMLSLHCA